MRGFQTSAIRAGIIAAVLLSPVLAFFFVLATETLADLLIELGFPVLFSLMATGAVGWALLRKISPTSGVAFPPGSGEMSDAPAFAGPSR